MAAGNPDGSEGHRHDSIEFKDIGNIVDKRLRLAGVDKTDRRGIPRRQDGRLADTVDAGRSR